MATDRRVELIDVNRIVPSSLRVRGEIGEEPLQSLATTIGKVGLLQPISVRPKGRKFEIIQGERRWRAAKLAGLKKITAIVKEVDDQRALLESLIENVHREDLGSIEKGKGLAEVYRLEGFEPSKVQSQLKMINNVLTIPERYRELTEEEKKVKEIADMVGLSYDYQYRLLTQLRLSPKEQKRVDELGLGYEETSSIATIEKPEVREKVIEIAPELKRDEIKKTSKIVRKGPERLVNAVVEREIEPKVAEALLGVPKGRLDKAIEEVKALRLTPEEVKEYARSIPVEAPAVPLEKVAEVLRSYEELKKELEERMKAPEMEVLGRRFRNLSAHTYASGASKYLSCPICGADWKNLSWKCHGLSVEEAIEMLREMTKSGGKSR